MKIISHRGNLKGPEPETENSPKKIEEALKLGYDCEVDVWHQSGVFTLCHDFKNNKHYNVNVQFLIASCQPHAKNTVISLFVTGIGVDAREKESFSIN